MYKEMFIKMLKGVSPFHNRVLRFNYDLPLENLAEVLKIVTGVIQEEYNPQNIFLCRDDIESSGRFSDGYEKMENVEFEKLLEAPLLLSRLRFIDMPGEKAGLFGEDMEWYLRLSIEEESNVGPGEPITGNVEVYTHDRVVEKMIDKFKIYDKGHLIVEGAKKYLEEVLA